MELTINIILLIAGITILVWGANKFVDHASIIAKHLGVGDLVIGLTLIAAGTSAPEVFVGISAVLNGNEDIALWRYLFALIPSTPTFYNTFFIFEVVTFVLSLFFFLYMKYLYNPRKNSDVEKVATD